jgi:hypothetical protein
MKDRKTDRQKDRKTLKRKKLCERQKDYETKDIIERSNQPVIVLFCSVILQIELCGWLAYG